MLQKPNVVLVGKKVNALATSLAVGDVVVVNAETGVIIPVADLTADKVDKIQLGVVKKVGANNSEAVLSKSNVIDRNMITSIQALGETTPVAATEASAVVTFAGTTFVEGNRYVIRVVYKDIYQHPGQFTHTYEVIAGDGETVTTIATKFADVINNHKGARVTAANAAGVLTLTAKSIASTVGLLPNQEFTQVQIGAVAVYYTVPGKFLAYNYNKVPGVTVAITPSKPGKGNPYIVKDREYAALGYKGVTNRITWPTKSPASAVDLSKTYHTLTVEFGRLYQSPDNSYVKRTECAVEVYSEADVEALRLAIATWGEVISGTQTGN